jgi:deoxyribodipyrimidine photo-lyase
MGKVGIVWFRNNLRLHDNEPLHRAVTECDQIIAVYTPVFHLNGTTPSGFPKVGPHRYRFLREAVDSLRENLRTLGGELHILPGNPIAEIRKITQATGSQVVYTNSEHTAEEIEWEEDLKNNGLEVKTYETLLLVHPEDVSKGVDRLPKGFTSFRKRQEAHWTIRNEFPKPTSIPFAKIDFATGDMPTFNETGLSQPEDESRAAIHFEGGEDAALERLHTYFWQRDELRNYKFKRNGLLGEDYSSKFSAWLALGCISPRHIYWEVKRYEREVHKNVSTYWLVFELLWRDFFRLTAIKQGNNFFKYPRNRTIERTDKFDKWMKGQTGIPFIDANMIELARTGFMSNRGRQNVASFLCKDLGVNWQLGAEYFEHMLIDYDPCSNYGNWMYVAGVGADPRKDRYFNILKQANMYDEKGKFVLHWLPELRDVPVEMVHTPWMSMFGENYPEPIVKLPRYS